MTNGKTEDLDREKKRLMILEPINISSVSVISLIGLS